MKTAIAAAIVTLGGLVLAAPGAQAARSFCCTDDQGVRNCGDVLPEACRNKAYSEFNEKGQKVRSQDAPLTEAQQAVRDAEQKKKREEDKRQQEQHRRDQALLNTYTTEADLDAAQARQLAELDRSVKQAQEKIAAAEKTRDRLAKDTEFYKNKPLPPDLKDSIKRNEADIQAQRAALEARNKEIGETRARFDADRQRLRELRAPADGKR